MCDVNQPNGSKEKNVVTPPPQNPHASEATYVELAKLAHAAFCDRRLTCEWKLAFGLWTGIGIFTYFAVQNPGVLCGKWVWITAGGYCFIGGLWIFLWEPMMRRGFEVDKDWKHYYMHKAENRPEEECKDPLRKVYWRIPWLEKKKNKEGKPERSYWKTWCDPWSWVQIVPTVFFLIGSWVVIHNTGIEKDVYKEIQDRTSVQDSASVTVSGDNLQKIVDKIAK